MLEIENVNLDDLAGALADQTAYERPWTINRTTGALDVPVLGSDDSGFEPDDSGFESDDPELVMIDPAPSRVWYRDMVDFANLPGNERAHEDLHRALDGRGAFRRFRNVLHDRHPDLVPAWRAFEQERGRRRAVDWLRDNELITDEAADRYLSGPAGAEATATEARNPDTVDIDLLDTIGTAAARAALDASGGVVRAALARLR